MTNLFLEGPTIYHATLAGWAPKCNQEMEVRVRLNFEVPLFPHVIDLLPKPLERLARTIANLEEGLTEGTISNDYQQCLEILDHPAAREPVLRLENMLLTGMHMFRPVLKDGPTSDLFMCFSTTVRAEGPFGAQLVTWALPHLRRSIFFRAYELQGRLPLHQGVAA